MTLKWPLVPLLVAAGLLIAGTTSCGDDSGQDPVCGNTVLEGDEQCDDGTESGTLATGACSSECTWQEFNPDIGGSGSAKFPAVAMNSLGQFVVVWHAFGPVDGDGEDVYAVVYDSNGLPLTTTFRVNDDITDDQVRASVGMDDQGRIVVVWHTEFLGTPANFVYLRAFGSDGSPLTGDVQMNTYTAGEQTYANVAVNGAGSLVAAWTSDGQDGELRGVYARLGDTSGQLAAGEPFQVNTETANDQENPWVGLGQDGRFVIAWRSTGQETS